MRPDLVAGPTIILALAFVGDPDGQRRCRIHGHLVASAGFRAVQPSLGDRSYIVHDGSVAVVIDPQRDIDRVLADVDAASRRLTHVLETHVHNDYVSGGLALARRTGAEYVTCADDDARFERRGVVDGDEIVTGTLTIRAVHTPGHTPLISATS